MIDRAQGALTEKMRALAWIKGENLGRTNQNK